MKADRRGVGEQVWQDGRAGILVNRNARACIPNKTGHKR